ncbi:MAG: hypothetical protein ACLQQ4_14380 [Bacteroidia bacterium]
MTDKQIEERLQEIENKNPNLFKQFKLKDHIFWSPLTGTDKLTWGFHPPFVGNLPLKMKVEVSKIMNKMTKGGYEVMAIKE